MKRIGILGGTFNPIHKGHLMMAEIVQEKKNVEEIHFLPCYQSLYKKQKEDKIVYHRKKMIEIAIKSKKNWFLNDYEIKRKEISYTIDTIKGIKGEMKEEIGIYFIIGSDQELSEWKDINQLKRMVKFISFERKGNKREQRIKDLDIEYMNREIINISSTRIRRESIREKIIEYVPEEIYEYICKNKLYY